MVYPVADVSLIIFIIFDYPMNKFALSDGFLLRKFTEYYFLKVLSILLLNTC